MLYCVRYKNNWESFGFIKPYNAVRDGSDNAKGTYSLNYMPPSMIDGIMKENCFGKIVRSKMSNDNIKCGYNLNSEQIKAYSYGFIKQKGIKGHVPKLHFNSIHKRYLLTNPEITLAFECKEDALKAVEQPIYVGQTEFILYPNGDVIEMTEEDFDKITGFECFSSNKEDPEAIYVGNNRQRNNERMYVKIKYTE